MSSVFTVTLRDIASVNENWLYIHCTWMLCLLTLRQNFRVMYWVGRFFAQNMKDVTSILFLQDNLNFF